MVRKENAMKAYKLRMKKEIDTLTKQKAPKIVRKVIKPTDDSRLDALRSQIFLLSKELIEINHEFCPAETHSLVLHRIIGMLDEPEPSGTLTDTIHGIIQERIQHELERAFEEESMVASDCDLVRQLDQLVI